ncbi:helix-turn-helix transcriptional regulator [Ruminococcus sp.]|uniref:helix-turn-helix domain-containing protein n=1 Tax=Ruminococcus sp. TaxID=41978 RepID=UPI0025F060A4|nr:helix-turn-helix transcriptional regulator [Ruminococcus sp.]
MILDYKQIGRNLARRRKELKLKQAEVCERAEINDKYLSCIETARSIPSLEVFLKLCTALGTTPDHILLGSVRQTEYAKDDAAMLEKFQSLSPNNKRLCLAFMDLLSDEFQNS